MEVYKFLILFTWALINFSQLAAETKLNILVNQRSAKLLGIMSKVSLKVNIKRELSGPEKKEAEILIKSNPMNLNLQDKDGKGSLMYSLIGANTSDLTSLLIKHGVNLNLQDKQGFTALTYALIYSNYDLVLELIRNGAFLSGSSKVKPNYQDTLNSLKHTKVINQNLLNRCKKLPDQLTKLEEAIKLVEKSK